jgi:AraC-like DNA-binding protein
MAIQEHFGKPLTPTELGKLLGISASTVRRHYRRFGGVEVAKGTFRFFENIVMEMIDANLRQTLEESTMEGSGNRPQESERTSIPGRQPEKLPRRRSMGRRDPEGNEGGADQSRHGL